MANTQVVPLHRKHPNLFRMVLAIAVVNIVMCAALILLDPQRLINFSKLPDKGIIPPLWTYGVWWGIAGLIMIYGIFRDDKYRWARRGLTMSVMVGGFWAFGFVVQFLAGTIQGISAPVLWSFYTIICMAVSNEPSLNPLSAILQSDIHATLTEEQVKGLKNHGKY